MAVEFDGIPFDVIADGDGRLPRAVRQPDKTWLYTAEVMIDDSDMTDFEARFSWLSAIEPALGAAGGRITVDYGPGALVCTIPQQGAAERTGNAILIDLVPRAKLIGGDFRCDMTLLFLARPS